MVVGWLECLVVVCALPLALEQGLGGAKPEAMSGADFALGVIKRVRVHATAQRYHTARVMSWTN